MLQAFLLFVKAWLFLGFVLLFVVAPLYLIAIFPDVPEPMVRAFRGIGYGVVRAPASETSFWYRIAGCGTVIAIGCAIIYSWTKAPSQNHEIQEKQPTHRRRERRSKKFK